MLIYIYTYIYTLKHFYPPIYVFSYPSKLFAESQIIAYVQHESGYSRVSLHCGAPKFQFEYLS